jgi:hypothetical protein
MKKFFALGTISSLIFLAACSNDFELTASWKDIPVVYGILSATDTAHYIRVEKAFLDPETDALLLAQNPDSLYYPNAKVELVRLSNNRTYQLTRVDGNAEGYRRDTGIFASAPNYLYKIRRQAINLVGNEEIEFRLSRGENLPVVTARTTVLPPMEFASSRPPVQINIWTNEDPVRVAWRPNNEQTVIFDLEIVTTYDEVISATGVKSRRILRWKPLRNLARTSSENIVDSEIQGDAYYQFLANNIEKKSGVVRGLVGIDFVAIGGGRQVLDFVNITFANSGITGSQDVPVYTNLNEGFGIFSSKTEARVKGILLARDARDSLLNGRFTGGLNFL